MLLTAASFLGQLFTYSKELPLYADRYQDKDCQGLGKIYKLYDSNALYIEVPPSGKKRWRFKYYYAGKEKRISLGTYPDIGLKEAREKRDLARKIVAEGNDPSVIIRSRSIHSDTFQDIALEWIDTRKELWSERHTKTVLQRLNAYIFPYLGSVPIQDISALNVLEALRIVEKRGATEAAGKTLNICSLVFRYAVATARIPNDPCRDLKGALTARKKGHFAAITDKQGVAALLRAIESYQGSALVRCALKFLALTFVRPGELRSAEWQEINFSERVWIIPAEKMEMGREHIVSLSNQALSVLYEVKEITPEGEPYVFPSIRRRKDRRLSEGTLNVAIRSMGFGKEQMTAHGFRAMASTLLTENGWRPDVIERQLAHVEKNKVRGAHNRAEYLQERRIMMQEWADFLDSLLAMYH